MSFSTGIAPINRSMTKEEILAKKKERAAAKRLMIDKLRFWVGVFSVPTILVMACMLIGAAYYLGESQLAVVVGLISTITFVSKFCSLSLQFLFHILDL